MDRYPIAFPRSAFFLAALLPAVAAIHAQSPASGLALSGVVTDSTGAVLPRARVLLRGPAQRETLSGVLGAYQFPGLRPGDYTLTFALEGFEPAERRLTLAAASRILDLVLQPAVIRQALEVTAEVSALAALTRLPGTLHETPRAVTVVGAGEIRARDLRAVPELLSFVPGFTPNSYRAGGYHFYARGYRMGADDTRVDGFVGLNVSGSHGASLFGVEQVLVLRGPAGLVYGATGSPGGLVNLVTRKPRDLRSTRLDFRAGAYPGQGLGLASRPSASFDFDSTGALIPGGRVLYRTLFTLENHRYFTAGVLDRNRYANTQLTVKFDRSGLWLLTPVFQYARFHRPAGGGILISPSTSLSSSDGLSAPIYLRDLSPHSVNPSLGGRLDETGHAGFDFRAIPTERARLNLSYRGLRNDGFVSQFTPLVSTASQIALLRDRHTVARSLALSDTDRRYQNLDASGSYEFRGASWKNFMQLGLYSRHSRVRATSPLGPLPGAHSPINIYTGLAESPLRLDYPALAKSPFARTTDWNGYFQNRTSLFSGRLIAAVGLGHGRTYSAGAPVQSGGLTPNFSLLYNPAIRLALYASYAASFNPIDPSLENAAGLRGAFDPVRGGNYELGARFEPPSRRLSANLSFFRNHIANALVQTGTNDVNRNGNRYYLPAGTRRGKGAELSVDYRLRPAWTVSGAASYTSSVYTGEGPPSAASTLALPGSPAEKTPRWAGNARTFYNRSEGRFPGFGAGLSFLWQDQRLGGNGARTLAAPDPLILPSYARVDASVSYRINRHVEWSLNVDNLFDRVIFINATVGSAMEIAPPRAVATRLSYTF